MEYFRLRCRFSSIRKQRVRFLDEGLKEMFQTTLPSIVQHEPYTYWHVEFVRVTDEPFGKNLSGSLQIDTPKPRSDRPPSILQ